MMGGTYEALAAIFRPQAEMQSMMMIMMASAALMTLMFCYIFTRGHEGKGIMDGSTLRCAHRTVVGRTVGDPSARYLSVAGQRGNDLGDQRYRIIGYRRRDIRGDLQTGGGSIAQAALACCSRSSLMPASSVSQNGAMSAVSITVDNTPTMPGVIQ